MNKQSEQSCGVWNDEMATWYVDQWGEHPMHDKIVELCNAEKTSTVLDIGCGSGPVVRRFAQYLTDGEVIGIDPTAKMVELAQKHTEQQTLNVPVRFDQRGAEDLPCDNHSVDLVVAVNSLHHWQDVPKGLSEIKRVLSANGKLVVIDELWDEMPEFEKPQNADPETFEHIAQFKNIDTVIAALKTAGFNQLDKQIHRSKNVAVSVLTVTAH